MAQLDPLLNALVERQAQELVLSDGERPALRYGESLKPVSPMSLNRTQIAALLTELSAGVEAGRLAPGQSTSFVYSLGGATPFLCEVVNEQNRLLARLVPQANEKVAAGQPATPDPSAARPAETASPEVACSPARPSTAAPEIDTFLARLVELGASDLHLSAEEVPRIRLHGDIMELPEASPLPAQRTRELLEAIIPEYSRNEFQETHDADFGYQIDGLARFRVNVFVDRKGVGGVLRVIPTEIMTAEQLGLPEVLLRLCELPKGLVLVTGPTGSGKSTTLATMVDHVNRTRSDHIITIEDPIEFVHENQKCLVNQREIHTHTGAFKTALRAALREDPDIVLVGELRDLETIAIAIETAETGHLVFGTLHTSTACSTVDRVIDQFPADRQAQIRTMLSESLRGVVSQVLLKKNGGGRVAAMEVLVVSPAISNLIREAKTFQIPSLMQTGKKQGMVLLNDALLDLVRKKIVQPEEALDKADDKPGFASQLEAAGIRIAGQSRAAAARNAKTGS